MFGGFSPWHWMFILVIAVLLFGNRLPEIARSLGRSVNEFKKGLREVKDQFDEAAGDDPPHPRLDSPPDLERLDNQRVVDRETIERAGQTSKTQVADPVQPQVAETPPPQVAQTPQPQVGEPPQAQVAEIRKAEEPSGTAAGSVENGTS